MIAFLSEYLSTIVIGLLVLAAVTGAVVSIVRDKRKGIGSCGRSCASCPSAAGCSGSGDAGDSSNAASSEG